MNLNIRIIIRNLLRKPTMTVINLLGLSASLVLVIILSVYCYSELTTDSYHPSGDNIYLLGRGTGIHTPAILKENVETKVPGVEKCIRIGEIWQPVVLKSENNLPITTKLTLSDPGLFDFFSYRAVEGDLSTALDKPLSLVLTEKIKQKLFGNESAIGKTVKYNNDKYLTVTAVIEEPKKNTFLTFNALTSVETKKIIDSQDGEFEQWGWCNYQTFVLLDGKVSPADVANNTFQLLPKRDQNFVKTMSAYPLKELYFKGFWTGGSSYFRQGDKSKTIILLLVAALILIVAMVNFINISSAQWAGQINKTGVLKVIGASRFNIFRNLIAESTLLFSIAIFLALLALSAVAVAIQNYTGMYFNTRLIYSPVVLTIILTATVLLSVVLSLIPGLRISASRAVDNIKKSVSSSKKKHLQGGLLTLQMAISIVLISFTVLVYKQIEFGSNNMTFDQNNTIAIRLTEETKKDVLQNELNSISAVKNTSFTEFYPGADISNWSGCILAIEGKEQDVAFSTFFADGNFFNILGTELVSGEFYSNNYSNDKNKAVVNEEFVRHYNVDNPVGGAVYMGENKYEISGVVKDFNYKSVNSKIEPLVISYGDYMPYCLVQIDGKNFKSIHQTVENIKGLTAKMSPDFPVEISFLDNAVNKMYESEVRFRRIFSLFAISAIIICAMGILAMSIFAAQQRTKEIGVRKVNGATISEILLLLNNSFIKSVLVAFIIATPIAYLAMHKWLENFAYKTTLSWWIFALAGVLALGIALLTVSWQSWKAATRNPVEALRYE